MNESLELLIASLLLILLGIYIIIRKAGCKTEIEAVLIRKERRRARKGGRYYCGTFSFEYEGNSYSTDVSLGTSERLANLYAPKAKYKIYINPRRPKIAYIDDTVNEEFFFPILLGITGLVVYLLK